MGITYEGRLINPDGSDGNIFESSKKGESDKPLFFKLGEG